MKQHTLNRFAVLVVLLISGLIVAPSYAATRPTDSNIDLWVKTALNQDPRITNADIAVMTKNGIVTLSGDVKSLAAHNYAEMEAKKIRGVLGVINEIIVSPIWRSDEAIRDAVQRRLEANSTIQSHNLGVAVANGEATLSGTVASWAEHEQAGLIASEVAGVKKVKNDIVTNWSASRTDDEIQGDVRSSLARDVYLTGLPIRTSVLDGVVTLSGTVGNAYERDRALQDARWVRGVATVINTLDVDWLFNRGVASDRRIPSDEELKAAIRAELDQDWRLDSNTISIDVHAGNVTLEGSVLSHREIRIAEIDARDVVGVAWVTNRLSAKVDARTDQAILDDVKFSLDTDFATADLAIDATVRQGIVTLSGEVLTWFDRSQAATVAADVRGVKEVVNEITVAPSSWKIDADLTASIKSGLTWNWTTWWVHDDIGVAVHNGVATLSGNVHTWVERIEAANVALDTPGVWKVDNRLMVNGYDYPWSEYYFHGPYEYGLKDIR